MVDDLTFENDRSLAVSQAQLSIEPQMMPFERAEFVLFVHR